jgi:hypothetical protein
MRKFHSIAALCGDGLRPELQALFDQLAIDPHSGNSRPSRIGKGALDRPIWWMLAVAIFSSGLRRNWAEPAKKERGCQLGWSLRRAQLTL